VAVVATRAGGIGEVISEGVEGFLSAVEDWKILADYGIWLIKNKEELKAMKLAARHRVVREFSMKKMVHELEKVYLEVLPA
jgi:glycosyltransferase involved in cell wall biosynthesis